MVKWPGQHRPGAVSDVPVISTDLYPTILEMAGVPQRPEQHQDGVSLVPLLKGENHLDRKALFWHFPHYSNHGMQSPGGAIRQGDFKLLNISRTAACNCSICETTPASNTTSPSGCPKKLKSSKKACTNGEPVSALE